MPNVQLCAQALVLLHNAQIVADPNFIHALGTIVRQSTEPAAPRYSHCTAHFRSQAAGHVIAESVLAINSAAQYEAFCKAQVNQIRHEHMVPTKVRIQLLNDTNWSLNEVEESLTQYGKRASITYAEDAMLTAMGLRTKMPKGFYENGHSLFRNPFARYIAAGIYPNLVSRNAETWFLQDHI